MPNRILRDWTMSEKVDKLSVYAERFFTRLIMKVDDYGRYTASLKVLRASLFPLKVTDIKEADISNWLGELEENSLIICYEVAEKQYLEILGFRQRLRQMVEKHPSVKKSTPKKNDGQLTVNGQTIDGVKPETRNQKEIHPALAGEPASMKNELSIYAKIPKDKKSIHDFIQSEKPKFIEPYVDLWNLFAHEKGLPAVMKITAGRKRKFTVRINEPGFDFHAILKKANQSDFLLTGKWFAFDWILENNTNYMKVIEGNYDNKTATTFQPRQKNQVVI